MKGDKKVAAVASPSTELSHSEDHFPSLHASTATATSTVNTSTTSASSGEQKAASGNMTTLADRFAMATNHTVQHGGMNDFPSLSELARPEPQRQQISAPVKNKLPMKPKVLVKEDDFPGLPTSGKSAVSNVNTNWTKPTKTKDKEPKPNPNKFQHKPPINYSNESDFPTLGAPANSNSSSWFRPASKPSNHAKKTSQPKSMEASSSDTDIRDRFSPVNIPDSTSESKNKNKKKKKKDKVSEMKEEKLHGSSSLDDIASMLLTSSVSSEVEKKPVVAEVSESKNKSDEKPVSTNLPEEKPRKKKEDKVEKRMESQSKYSNSVNSQIEDDFTFKPKEIPEDFPSCIPNPVTFAVSEDDFPSLGGGSQKKAPPPGFRGVTNNTAKKSQPPGFHHLAQKLSTPPGFGAVNGTALSSHKVVDVNGNDDQHEYLQPDDFAHRNQMLIATIQSMCGDDFTKFNDFKKLSGEFRRGDIDAEQYYHQCGSVLGKSNFKDVVQELMALLPDIPKQSQLLAIFMEELKRDSELLISEKSSNKKGAWTPSSSGFLTCQTCGQVLVRRDYNQHVSAHNILADFPSLS